MIFSCKEATLRIEKKISAQRLNLIEKIQLNAHLSMCKACKIYEKKVVIIDQSMVRITNKTKDMLTVEEKTQFQSSLHEKLQQNK